MENTVSTIVASEKSTHEVQTFILTPELIKKHENADSLSTVKIPGTEFTCIIRTEDWTAHVNKLCAYIQPDSIVDITRPEFSFLGPKGSRIRAKKLRGIVSYGLLVPVADSLGLSPGQDARIALGVEHYDPDVAQSNDKTKKNYTMGGDIAPSPVGVYPKYDVDNAMKYAKRVFQDGELVYVTEKLHGCSAKYMFKDGSMHCSSRTEWKTEFTTPPKITLEELTERVGDAERAKAIYDKAVNGFVKKKNLWWQVLDATPALRAFCEAHPGWCVYGEVFGQIQKGFSYGIPQGQSAFAAFDILVPGENGPRWLNAADFMKTCDDAGLPRVPHLGTVPFNFEALVAMAEGNTTMPNATHIQEGIVFRPIEERWNEKLGRVLLKLVSAAYLEKN